MPRPGSSPAGWSPASSIPSRRGRADENYSIAVPPPNVTGALHMGHALNGSVQDTLIRYNRMLGKRTKWTLGTDHAGIATQTQVEKLLRREGASREGIGREAFIERVWQWREEYGGIIFGQFQRLGASMDYEEERFTLDPSYVRAVLKVFVDLYDKGLIYRDNYMVNWDPGSRSAISDLEVEDREVTDTLYHVDYPLASGGGSITVATVRPETILADTAIAVHPDDPRYTRLVGETRDPAARRPPAPHHRRPVRQARVRHRRAEDHARPRPQRLRDRPRARARGDRRDRRGRPHERGRRRALRRHDARSRRARPSSPRCARQGAVARTEPYTHAVPFSHRSGERIEPLISLQWFMKMEELAAPAIAGRPRRHAARPSGEPAQALPRLAGEHPPLVHLAPALVGPSDPGLVPRGGDLRRHGAAGGRRLGARPRRARHLVLVRRCGRSRRSAGPTTRPSCARSTRPTCSRRAATSSSSGSRAW